MNTIDLYEKMTKRLIENPEDRTALQELISIYPDAWREYDHEITDSIALYVSNLGDMDTIVFLEAEIGKIDDQGIVKEFQDWIAYLRQREIRKADNSNA